MSTLGKNIEMNFSLACKSGIYTVINSSLRK